MEEMSLVLVGKCGSGKSSLGNSLLLAKKFKVNMFGGTDVCQIETRNLDNRQQLVVMDTPGFSSLNRSDDETEQQLDLGLQLLNPGRRIFILVISLRDRQGKADIELLKFLQSKSGIYTMVVFTGVDQLEDEEITLAEYLQTSTQEFRNFFESNLKTRIHTINNKDKSEYKTNVDTILKLAEQILTSNMQHLSAAGTSASCSVDNSASNDVKDEHVIKVMLLGKSGMGKSALGNSLLRKKNFKTNILENLGTKQCQLESRSLDDGTKLIIADTPGFFRMTRSNQEIITELQNCLDLLKPGPHVFILVLSINERFTGDEAATIEFLETVFGKDVFTHIIIVFTWLDILLDADSHLYNKNFQEIIPACTQQILSKCGHRKTGINNKGSKEELQEATKNILDAVVSLVKINNYSSYTRNMIQETQASINELKHLDNHGEQSGFWNYTKSTIKRKFENISKTIKRE